jgi:hypothetical protein
VPTTSKWPLSVTQRDTSPRTTAESSTIITRARGEGDGDREWATAALMNDLWLNGRSTGSEGAEGKPAVRRARLPGTWP